MAPRGNTRTVTSKKTTQQKKAPAKTGAKGPPERKAQPSAKTTGGDGAGIKATNLSPEDKRFLTTNKEKLSPSTLRAKWIQTPDDHEDKAGQSLATRKHEVIEHWAEERGASPATVKSTKQYEGDASVLRFDFPGFGGRNLETIEWDRWFKTFDKRKLVFLFQEHKADGAQSNFFRFDSPFREEA